MAASSIPSNLQPQQILDHCSRLHGESQQAEANFDQIKEDIKVLFPQVMAMSSNQEESTLLQKTIVYCNRKNPVQSSLILGSQDLEPLLGEFKHILGDFNQFDLNEFGVSNACTNCAQYFLAWLFFCSNPKEVITKDGVNETVIQGTANYGLLMHLQRLASKVNQTPIRENLAHSETKEIYPLESIKLDKTVYDLKDDSKGSTEASFTFTLSLLEQVFIKEGAPVGIVMHVHDKSFALAAFRDSDHKVYYVFFDSHGEEVGEGQRTPAYVITTPNPDELAKFLSRLIPKWKFTDPLYTPEERKIIEEDYKERNEYALNFVRLNMLPPSPQEVRETENLPAYTDEQVTCLAMTDQETPRSPGNSGGGLPSGTSDGIEETGVGQTGLGVNSNEQEEDTAKMSPPPSPQPYQPLTPPAPSQVDSPKDSKQPENDSEQKKAMDTTQMLAMLILFSVIAGGAVFRQQLYTIIVTSYTNQFGKPLVPQTGVT